MNDRARERETPPPRVRYPRSVRFGSVPFRSSRFRVRLDVEFERVGSRSSIDRSTHWDERNVWHRDGERERERTRATDARVNEREDDVDVDVDAKR